ncbi:MAG: aspartate-semialdehyde dehydrogenase [Eubacteriales bacterium]|nr:aspartate-semialdehyde dehydrogenase [Eubacteriales bacterium]
MKMIKAGIIGATGMVGQRFIKLLENHPFFEVRVLAASKNSAGKRYEEAVANRWKMDGDIPAYVRDLTVLDVRQIDEIAAQVDMVFSAVEMSKEEIKAIEEDYAKAEVVVVSNNSAHRWTPDVPMVVPEINPEHLAVLDAQKKRLGTKRGYIVVKPNCSIQSYAPALYALRAFEPYEVVASTYQAISGAGKTFETWPEMVDNVIPYIGGEEEKSEQEPLRLFGSVQDGKIVKAQEPVITAHCIRVPVSAGHFASVFVKFRKKPTKEQILEAWRNFKGEPQAYDLPHAPEHYIHYFEDNDRPQAKMDRDMEGGMAVSIGRLAEDTVFDYKFVGLSHNTIRGAAGGAVLIAELLAAKDMI